MSDFTASVAVDTTLITQTDTVELGFDMLALMEAVDFEYERFCRILGMDPDDDATADLFYLTHQSYVQIWKQLGDRDWDKAMDEYRSKWRRLVGTRG